MIARESWHVLISVIRVISVVEIRIGDWRSEKCMYLQKRLAKNQLYLIATRSRVLSPHSCINMTLKIQIDTIRMQNKEEPRDQFSRAENGGVN